MTGRRRRRLCFAVRCTLIAAALPWLGCGRVGYDPVAMTEGDGGDAGSVVDGGGASGSGGVIGSGGTSGSGGASGAGGVSGRGGASGAGGVSGRGGASGAGGVSGRGGASGAGGVSGRGGASGGGGVSGRGGGSGAGGASGRGGVSGTGGGSGRGGASGGGGVSGRGGVSGAGGASGRGGVSGTGGGSGRGGVSGGGAGGTLACLEALADRAAFDAAASGLTAATEDFTVDASGNPVTSFGYYASDAFAHHADITFESFVTSLQAPPGTREARVFSLAGVGVKSSIGFAPGFDGITSRLSAPERAMAYAGRVPLGTEGFTLTVQRSDTGERTSFTFHPTNQVLFAGVRSRCGGIIQVVDLLPNFSATGDGNSQYWELASVSYAR